MFRESAAAASLCLLAGSLVFGWQRGAESVPGSNPRAAGISGRVVDRSGQPVKGAFVTALYPNPERTHGFEFVSARLRAETNDAGEFMLDNLTPGEYYVIAVPRNPPVDAAGRMNTAGYANTFHPDSTRLADATLVRVTPLVRATANITLAPAKLATLSGVVIAASGKPVPGGQMGLARGDGLFGLFGGMIKIAPDGAFLVGGLQPGTYHLHYREGTWPPPRDVQPQVSGAKVIVNGDNVTKVVVAPIPLVRASGRIVVDSAARTRLNWSEIGVAGVPIDFDGNPGPQRAGAVNDDLTFEFRTWPCLGRVVVNGLPRGWSVAAVRLATVDVTKKPIEFAAGKDLTGLEIELSGPAKAQ
jgi:hypothetical protein